MIYIIDPNKDDNNKKQKQIQKKILSVLFL